MAREVRFSVQQNRGKRDDMDDFLLGFPIAYVGGWV